MTDKKIKSIWKEKVCTMASKFPLASKMAARWRKERIPCSGTFELTPRCNLDCKMCYIHLTRDQMGDRRELSVEEWIRIADEAIEAGMYRALITGGECLLYPGFWELYTHLRGKGIMVPINSNGVLMTEEVAERFRELPPNQINISLYGLSEETYERCTGHRVYGRVLENIIRLRDMGMPLCLSATGSRYNRDEVWEIVQKAKELQVSSVMDVNLTPARKDTGRSLGDYGLSPEEQLQVYRKFRRNGPRPIIPPEKPLLDYPRSLPGDPDYRGVLCGAGKIAFNVTWDGRFGCCFDLMPDPPIYVREHSFAECWEAAKAWVDTRYLAPVECRDCPLREICETCVVRRADPKNPGHCNPNVCRVTFMQYNEGLARRKEDLLPRDEEQEPYC